MPRKVLGVLVGTLLEERMIIFSIHKIKRTVPYSAFLYNSLKKLFLFIHSQPINFFRLVINLTKRMFRVLEGLKKI